MQFNWAYLLVGIAIGFIIHSIYRLIAAYFRVQKLREQKKFAEAQIEELSKKFEKKKKELEDSLKQFKTK